MTDTVETAPVPETPPAAPVHTDVTPQTPATPDVLSVLGGGLFAEMGFDQRVFDFIKDSPSRAGSILSAYKKEIDQIKTVGDVASLQIETKMYLLVMSWFSGSTESVAGMVLPDELTTKMKDASFSFDEFQKAHPADGDALKWAEGATHNHAIWTGKDLFKLVEEAGSVDFTDASKLADWPNLFPYVPGSRVAVGKSTDLDAVKRLWTQPLQSGEVTLTVIPAGTALTAPGPREIQVIGMPDLGTDLKPGTWATLDAASKVWEDGVNTQFSGCGRTLAALQMMEYKKTPGNIKTAQEACDAVGYKPAEAEKVAFLAWLDTAPDPLATSEPEPETSDNP